MHGRNSENLFKKPKVRTRFSPCDIPAHAIAGRELLIPLALTNICGFKSDLAERLEWYGYGNYIFTVLENKDESINYKHTQALNKFFKNLPNSDFNSKQFILPYSCTIIWLQKTVFTKYYLVPEDSIQAHQVYFTSNQHKPFSNYIDESSVIVLPKNQIAIDDSSNTAHSPAQATYLTLDTIKSLSMQAENKFYLTGNHESFAKCKAQDFTLIKDLAWYKYDTISFAILANDKKNAAKVLHFFLNKISKNIHTKTFKQDNINIIYTETTELEKCFSFQNANNHSSATDQNRFFTASACETTNLFAANLDEHYSDVLNSL